MTRKEITGERDLTYSKYHRTLSNKCYYSDLDGIEYRYGRGIVALIETKLWYGKLTKHQSNIMDDFKQNTKYPLYIVWYTRPIKAFKVFNWRTKEERVMSEPEYREWIESL